MVGAVALAVAALLAAAIPARSPALSVEVTNALSDDPVSVVGVSALGWPGRSGCRTMDQCAYRG
jgi:hypothetical protein